MYLRLYIGLFLAFIVSYPAIAADRETVPALAPSSPWNLDATPSGCALRRAFGTGTPPLVIEMNRTAPTGNFELVVSGTELRGIGSNTRLTVHYGTLPGHDEPISFKLGTTERGGVKAISTIFATSGLGSSYFGESDGLLMLLEGQATEIRLEWRGKEVVLKTGSLAKPFQAMRQCTDALVKSWGLDPEVQRMLARRPQPIGHDEWVKQLDYPSSVASDGKQARVNVRLIVDEKGLPSDCKVLRSYNDPKFDAIACNTLKRIARFTPAMDRAGRAVPSYYTTTIIWSM
jgi:TonB family protein